MQGKRGKKKNSAKKRASRDPYCMGLGGVFGCGTKKTRRKKNHGAGEKPTMLKALFGKALKEEGSAGESQVAGGERWVWKRVRRKKGATGAGKEFLYEKKRTTSQGGDDVGIAETKKGLGTNREPAFQLAFRDSGGNAKNDMGGAPGGSQKMKYWGGVPVG